MTAGVRASTAGGTFDVLRARHPRFTYEDYAVERVGDDLRLTFSFTMAPDVAFAPTSRRRRSTRWRSTLA
jgi:hypothetical protein